MLSQGKNSMISYVDMTHNPYMYDPNNGDYNYILEDDNIIQINTENGEVKIIEYNDNDEVIKEYTAKLNTLCYKNNQIIKDTKDTLCIK